MILAVVTLAAYLRTCAPAVSADTMRAIVTVESHGYAYAINDNTAHATYCAPGTRIYPCSRSRAIAIAEAVVDRGHSVDLGIAQVNSGNFSMYHVATASMLDPCENLRVGSAILAAAYRTSNAHFSDQRDALWHAIMAYNTGSLYAGEAYVRSVVEAALGNELQLVPSIGILRGLAPARRHINSGAAHDRLTATEPRPQGGINPQSAPLLAEGLTPRRGGLVDTLRPVLSH